MAKTIVGLYEDRSTAKKVLDELESLGFGKDHLRLTSHDNDPRSDYHVGTNDLGTPDALTRYGIPNDEAKFYAEGVRRGHSLVVSRVHDDDAERVADVMARHQPVDYDQRSNAYREEGFTDYDASAAPYSEDQRRQERQRYAGQNAGNEQRVQEVEEHLKIGKRAVQGGGARVHKYVETDVVEETLRLREEHVDVHRRNADRALSPDEADAAFREETIDVSEMREEAVVEKEARVTGEVVVGKEVREREETVGGEVRRTRVDVEETGGSNRYDNDYQNHFNQNYGSTGANYSDYEPAYRYGSEMRGDSRYSNRRFEDVEGDLRSDYEGRHGRGAWEKTKDAVREGWNRVTPN